MRQVIDFTEPRDGHWANYTGGDNYYALFNVCGKVAYGDDILVRMQSGRVGRYRLFSVLRDWTGVANWKAKGMAIEYWTEPVVLTGPVKGLLSEGLGRARSNPSQSAPLSLGFTKPTSPFWEVLVRDDARRDRTNSMRARRNL